LLEGQQNPFWFGEYDPVPHKKDDENVKQSYFEYAKEKESDFI